jgi:hypothetical protein
VLALPLSSFDGAREPRLETMQSLDLLCQIAEVFFADLCHFTTRAFALLAHPKDCCDVAQRKAENLRMANKTEPVQIIRAVDSIARFRAFWLRKKPLAFVETHCLNIDPRFPRSA